MTSYHGDCIHIVKRPQDNTRLNVSVVGVTPHLSVPSLIFELRTRIAHKTSFETSRNIFTEYYSEQEKFKKDAYKQRVVEAEKGPLVPLIFTTSRGMGPMSKDKPCVDTIKIRHT